MDTLTRAQMDDIRDKVEKVIIDCLDEKIPPQFTKNGQAKTPRRETEM